MTIFKGLYADGKLVGPLEAEVNFTPAALRITYRLPGQAVPITVYWQVHRLVRETLSGSGNILFHYGTFPGQTLEISGSDFLPAYERYYAPAPVAGLPKEPILTASKKGIGSIYLFFIALILLIPISYFWVLPAAADLAARQLPMKYEQKLGNVLAKKMVDPEKVDSVKTAHLKIFLRHLKLQKDIPITPIVIQHPVPNAFAVPGGTLVVHQAMLPLLNKPEELAALIGHEVAHIQHRHSLRTLTRSLSVYILISLLFGDVSALTAIILQNAHHFHALVYSRQFEKEADITGLYILRQNNLNPMGMVNLFKQLQKQNPEQTRENEYLSSHPLLSSRISFVQSLISQKPYRVMENDSLNFYFAKLKGVSNSSGRDKN